MSPVDMSPEEEKFVADALTKMAHLMQRKTELCCHCGAQVKAMEQIGRSVYARPCGCRLWQGKVPDVWKPKKS